MPVAEEFVDLYEILELPLNAERNTLRKRINELYLDAQRNLDHRNFATRVEYQRLFEVTLPQARYILLDEGRRADYDRLVQSFRGTGGIPAPTQKPAQPDAPIDPSIPGTAAPEITPLPSVSVDTAQLAVEREELWSKWKSGLETALNIDESDASKPRPQAMPKASSPASSQRTTSPAPARRVPTNPTQTKTEPINFDFEKNDRRAAPRPELSYREPVEGISAAEVERRRDHRRRDAIKEKLISVGMLWNGIGIAVVVVPGFIALVLLTNWLYPRGGAPARYPAIPQAAVWFVGFVLIAVGAFFAAQKLSRDMRRKTVAQLSALPLDELLRKLGKS